MCKHHACNNCSSYSKGNKIYKNKNPLQTYKIPQSVDDLLSSSIIWIQLNLNLFHFKHYEKKDS